MTIADLWDAFWHWTEVHRAGAYLFRGQAEDVPIRPRIGRAEYGYALPKERQMFDAFRRAARPFVQIMPGSEFEWLALAQHHGLPTRLADWSTSPLVAAWFAVASFPLAGDAVIYGLDLLREDVEPFDLSTNRGVRSNNGFAGPLDIREHVYLIETPAVSSRITTQRGIFTLHGNPKIPLDIPENDRFIIPQCLREHFQERLLDLGIDASHIYPDLDGLCKALDWRLRTGKPFSAIA